MNEFLAIFATWQFLILAIGISAITFVIRTIIEYFILNNPKLPGNSKSKFWRDLVLVLLPVCLGMLFPLIGKSFPYPQSIYEPFSKFLFSASAGLISPTLYRVIKAMLWKNANSDPYNVFTNVVQPNIMGDGNQDGYQVNSNFPKPDV